MRSTKIALAAVLALAVVAATLVAWRSNEPDDTTRVTIGTGPSGGVYDAYGRGLEDVASDGPTRIVARPTAASVANLRMVHEGELDAGFTLVDVAALAVAGEDPFDEPQNIRAIARLYDNHTHLVVLADSPYTSVADLAGQSVSVGAPASGTEMVADRLLDLGGIASGPDQVDRRTMDLEQSANALESGVIEAFFWSGGLPTTAVAELAERTDVRLIDLAEHLPEMSERYGPYFVEAPIPVTTYAEAPAVRTIGVPSLLVVSADLDDEVAYALTETVMQSRDRLATVHPVALHLSTRSAISTLPVELHPGAAAYFRDAKYAHDASGAPGSTVRSTEAASGPPSPAHPRARPGADRRLGVRRASPPPTSRGRSHPRR